MAESGDILLIKKLYSKFAQTLSIGSAEAGPGENYLTLCSPGIMLEPKLAAEDGKVGQETWSRVLDQAPKLNWIYATKGSIVSEIYSEVLKSKELPQIELTPSQEKELEDARAIIEEKGEPTRKFLAFRKYGNAYRNLMVKLQSARLGLAQSGEPIPFGLEEEVNEARSEWSTFGARAEVEAAQATVNNLLQLNPNTWWMELENAYKAQALQGHGSYEPSYTYPSYPALIGDEGWTTFKFSEEEMHKQESLSVTEAGGGVSAGWGLLNISASGEYKDDTESHYMQSSGFSLTAEIKRGIIIRPWLNPAVFQAHTWRFAKGRGTGEAVSTGASAPVPGQPEGRMPLLPTGVLIARNVRIAAKFSEEEQELVEKAIKASASVGWGPFSISGHYNHNTKEGFERGVHNAGELAFAGAQIIGFLADPLPLCPSPDQSLPWPS
jgi:hypothetical protein